MHELRSNGEIEIQTVLFFFGTFVIKRHLRNRFTTTVQLRLIQYWILCQIVFICNYNADAFLQNVLR